MLAKISWRFVVILISAGIIAFLTFNYLDSLQETKSVVITTEDIPEKTIITEEMLKTVSVEAKSADVLVSNQVDDPELVVGGITRKKLSEGEPIKMDSNLIVFPEDRMEYLTESGEVNANKFIPNDKRLYTLGLEPNNVIDNRVKKGDFVDVILTGETTSKDSEDIFSRMILQYVEVYSVEAFDESVIGDMAKDSLIQHVTLMVTPQEAVALANAKEEGKLSLALNPSEGEEVDVKMIYKSTFER